MKRLHVRLRPLHADGTWCNHRVGPAGEPIAEGCTGRHHWAAKCSRCRPVLASDTDPERVRRYIRAHLKAHAEHDLSHGRVTDLPLPGQDTEVQGPGGIQPALIDR